MHFPLYSVSECVLFLKYNQASLKQVKDEQQYAQCYTGILQWGHLARAKVPKDLWHANSTREIYIKMSTAYPLNSLSSLQMKRKQLTTNSNRKRLHDKPQRVHVPLFHITGYGHATGKERDVPHENEQYRKQTVQTEDLNGPEWGRNAKAK